MTRWCTLTALCVACVAGDDVDPDAPEPTGDTVLVSDTEAPDTELPPDTDASPPDSDSDSDSDAPVDSDPQPTCPEPTGDAAPADLGPGFVDVTGVAGTTHAVWFDLGDPSTGEQGNATAGVFADVDSDGVTELLVTTQRQKGIPAPVRHAAVFEWADGAWVADDALTDAVSAFQDHVVLAHDLDGDGFTDLVLARSDQGIVWGDGPGSWAAGEPIPLPAGYPEPFGSFGAASVGDVDGDGLVDLLLGDDACRADTLPMLLLLQQGPRSFVPRSDLVDASHNLGPWTVQIAPLGDEGTLLAAYGAPCSAADPDQGLRHRVGLDPDGYPVFEGFDPTPADSTYKLLTNVAGGPLTFLDPMGAAVVDIDGDGRLDLTVSAGSERYDWFLSQDDGSLLDCPWQPAPWPTATGEPMFAWGLGALDLDEDGRTDMIVAHGDDVSTFLDQSVGPQVVRALWNDGGGFVDRTELAGLDWPGSWRSLAAGDPDGDGDLDLAVGGYAQLPMLLRNDLDTGHHGLTLSLRGTSSGAVPVGARVVVEDADVPTQTHVVGATASPTVWSEPVLHVGLGADPVLDRVTVSWPAGWTQVFEDLAAETLHVLIEPPVVEVDTRRLPADGASLAQISITPRDEAGEPRAAVVAVTITHGLGTLGSVVPGGDGQVVTLQAPAVAGSTRLEITVDGVPLAVHPRVFWE